MGAQVLAGSRFLAHDPLYGSDCCHFGDMVRVLLALALLGTVAAEDSYVCLAGQGKPFASFQSSADNDKIRCQVKCTDDTRCVAFDYTTKQKNDACRLYAAQEPRIGEKG